MPAPSYLLSTISAGSNPATSLVSMIGQVLSNAGWVYVEEASFTQGATPRYMRVFKCPAAQNKAGVDFYIGLVWNQAGGTYIAARAFEGYNAVAHTIQRPCITGLASQVPIPPGYVGSAADFGLDNTGGSIPIYTELLPTNALAAFTNYDVGVLASRSYLVVNVQPAGTATMGLTWLLGLFDPVYGDSRATFPPLVAVDLRSVMPITVGSASGVSRAPRVTTGPNAFAVSPGPESVMFGLYPGAVKELTSGTIRAVRIALVGVGAASGYTGNGAAYRGRVFDAVAVATGNSATVLKVGDTLTIGSKVYTALGSSPATANIVAAGSAGWFFDTAAGS